MKTINLFTKYSVFPTLISKSMRIKRRCLCVLLITIFSSVIVNAQTIISGKIVDTLSFQPLESASVSEVGTTSKTLTDQYGNFSLKVNNKNPDLLISNVGYKAVQVTTTGSSIKISMQPDISKLADVVVLNSNSAAKFSTLTKIDLDLKPVRNTQELLR